MAIVVVVFITALAFASCLDARNAVKTPQPAEKFEMNPPTVEMLSSCSADYCAFRYIRIDGKLAILNRRGGVAFVP
ncbi:MAG: hypothetical protein WC473_05470 [Patescibacteria group bacterium]|jgi:hypothetical protein